MDAEENVKGPGTHNLHSPRSSSIAHCCVGTIQCCKVIMIDVSLSLTYLSLFQGINRVQHDIIENVKEGREGTGGDISHFMVNFKPRSKVKSTGKLSSISKV